MSVEEFRQRYPYIAMGMSDEQIRDMIGPEPDPQKYYFDRILPQCHYSVTWINSGVLLQYIRIIHN